MAGEDSQDTGREGLIRAKTWLNLSTRVNRSWAYDDSILGEFVHFDWPNATGREKQFSFDLGGELRGKPFDGQSFLAEVKKYKYEMDLPVHFRNFLAKCYVALSSKPGRCDNFFWISWAPFQAQSWHKHATTESVCKAVAHADNRNRILNVEDAATAEEKVDRELASKVAQKIWLITLGDRQVELVPTEDHYYKMAEIFSRERGVGQ
jgi:hypothetical protein